MRGLLLAFVFAILLVSSVGFVSAIVPIQGNANVMDDSGSVCNSTSWQEIVNLTTSARKLNMFDYVNSAKPFVTSVDMPITLADGIFTDLLGSKYSYTQLISVGVSRSEFGKSQGDLPNPVLYYQIGTNPAFLLYKTAVVFNKSLNVSDSVNVQNQKIKILGTDYVIGGGSSNQVIYLEGGQDIILVGVNNAKNVIVDGTTHTVELVSTSSNTNARIVVDGVSRTVSKGESYAFAGGVTVYVKDIHHPAFSGDIRSIELMVGNSLKTPIKIANGATIKVGATATSVTGTWGAISHDNKGLVADFAVYIAKQESQSDHVGVGESFLNPVFGVLSFVFDNVNPALNDMTKRDTVKVRTDNNQYAFVTFNSARSGVNGPKEITYAYDNNTASTAVQPILAHQTVTSGGRGVIHVKEGEGAKLNDWIVINQGDAGTILEVTDLTVNSATEGKATFQDAITGESQTVTLTNGTGTNGYYQKSGVNFFGGNGYTIRMNQAGTTVNVTWNSGATAVFPRIKLKNGGWMAFLTSTTVSSSTSIIFPNGMDSLTTTGDGGRPANANSELVAGVNWIIDSSAGASNQVIYGISNANGNCDFSTAKGPAILFFEPKKWNDLNAGDFICVPLTTVGTTEIAIGDPATSGENSGYTFLTSDTYTKQAVDKYGTFVQKEDRTNENGVATIRYPFSQMYLNALLVAQGNSTNCTNSTLNGTKVNTPSYRLCSVNNTCVQVSGKGTSSCSTSNDCNNQTGPRHLECKYWGNVGACAYVSGFGNNTCLDSNNCNQYHSVCVGLTCSAILGNGTSSCNSDNDCSHLACVNGMCKRVVGTGVNSCNLGDACIGTSPPIEESFFTKMLRFLHLKK